MNEEAVMAVLWLGSAIGMALFPVAKWWQWRQRALDAEEWQELAAKYRDIVLSMRDCPQEVHDMAAEWDRQWRIARGIER